MIIELIILAVLAFALVLLWSRAKKMMKVPQRPTAGSPAATAPAPQVKARRRPARSSSWDDLLKKVGRLIDALVARPKRPTRVRARPVVAPPPSRPARKFPLKGVISFLVIALLLWWFGSLLYRGATGKTSLTGLMIALGSLTGVFLSVCIFAGLAGKARKATPASARAAPVSTSASTKRFSLSGLLRNAVWVLIVALLCWWLGSSIYGRVTKKATIEAEAPPSPRSGTFELKAGQDYIHTGIFFEAGDRIKYDQPEPKAFWIKNETKENLMVSKTLFVTQADRSGEVQLIPGPEDTRVSVTVVKRRKGSFLSS